MLSRARRGACEIVGGAALWRCRCEIVTGAALWRCRCRCRGRRSILCIWVCVCVAGVAFGSCLEGQDVVARAAGGVRNRGRRSTLAMPLRNRGKRSTLAMPLPKSWQAQHSVHLGVCLCHLWFFLFSFGGSTFTPLPEVLGVRFQYQVLLLTHIRVVLHRPLRASGDLRDASFVEVVSAWRGAWHVLDVQLWPERSAREPEDSESAERAGAGVFKSWVPLRSHKVPIGASLFRLFLARHRWVPLVWRGFNSVPFARKAHRFFQKATYGSALLPCLFWGRVPLLK